MQPPKFCGNCGESLNILSAAKIKTAASRKPVSAKETLKVDDPDGVDIYEVPRISKLSYSVETDNNKFDLKDLVPLDAFEDFKEDEPVNKPKKRGRPRKS
jgi:hypothetical protein|tara:strand:+ start:636 stop:935 length:300 start_codon:yes stop_codon:yes gene_type:complete